MVDPAKKIHSVVKSVTWLIPYCLLPHTHSVILHVTYIHLAPLVPLLYIMSHLLPSPSFLSPSSPFLFWLPLFLILLSFYRSSCNCHIYEARYWELSEGGSLEPWQGSPAYSWRCHYRRETGMFKSVATCFLRPPYMQQHVASRPTQNKAASCLSHWKHT